MKKLMIAASAALFAAVGFSDVESSNIVGYTTVAYSSRYMLNGNMFVHVGDDAQYNLYDFKMVGGDPEKDYIQYLEATRLYFDNAKKFYYYEDEDAPEDNGWYYKVGANADEKVEYEDAWIPKNTAFLCEIRSGSGVSLLYAGEVQEGEVLAGEAGKKIVLERPQQFNLYNNPLPRTVDLTEVKLTDFDPERDYIQFLEGDKLYLDNAKKFYYYEDEDAPEDNGWYYKVGPKADEPVEVGDCIIGIGEGFLGEFRSSSDTTIVFPSPM